MGKFPTSPKANVVNWLSASAGPINKNKMIQARIKRDRTVSFCEMTTLHMGWGVTAPINGNEMIQARIVLRIYDKFREMTTPHMGYTFRDGP